MSQARLFWKCLTALVSHKQCSSYGSELGESNFNHVFAATGSQECPALANHQCLQWKFCTILARFPYTASAICKQLLLSDAGNFIPAVFKFAPSLSAQASANLWLKLQRGPEGLCAPPAAPVGVWWSWHIDASSSIQNVPLHDGASPSPPCEMPSWKWKPICINLQAAAPATSHLSLQIWDNTHT